MEFVHEAAAALASVQEEIGARLREAMAGEPGVIVEPKGMSLTVHYRVAPDSREPQINEAFSATVAPFVESGSVRITTGKKVLEVRPNVEWDKGKAIAKLQETFAGAGLTVFFGDDRTDEDGFRVVQDSRGIAVFVGPARLTDRGFAPGGCSRRRCPGPGASGRLLRVLSARSSRQGGAG